MVWLNTDLILNLCLFCVILWSFYLQIFWRGNFWYMHIWNLRFAFNKDILNTLNYSLFITLSKTVRLLKRNQIWKNRPITKARLNGLENSQANLRCTACFNIALLRNVKRTPSQLIQFILIEHFEKKSGWLLMAMIA